VEFVELFSPNPILLQLRAPSFVRLVSSEVFFANREAQDISHETGVRIFRVPIPRNPNGILLRQYRVEDRLPFQSRRKPLPIQVPNQVKFRLADGAKKKDGFIGIHGSLSPSAARRALTRNSFAFS